MGNRSFFLEKGGKEYRLDAEGTWRNGLIVVTISYLSGKYFDEVSILQTFTVHLSFAFANPLLTFTLLNEPLKLENFLHVPSKLVYVPEASW